jgi:hypothetical protein
MGNVKDLSDDDIGAIFGFLPFSSLVRARCVCRRWHRLAQITVTKQQTSWCILSCPAKQPSPSKLDRSLSRCMSSRRLPGLLRSASFRTASESAWSTKTQLSEETTDNYHVVMFDPYMQKWLKVTNPFGHDPGGPFGSPTKELLWLPSTGGYSGTCDAKYP